MTFCDIHINRLKLLSIERLFAPWMFIYQIIIMLENEQKLVDNLNIFFTGYYHADCTANHKYVP